MTWQDLARTLTLGQKRKVKHCGTDPSAYISNGPHGVSLHCFRCGENVFEPHGRLSAADVLKMRQRDEEAVTQSFPEVLPLYADGVDPRAVLWVLKSGLSPEDATDNFGFGWDKRTQRAVVPLLHDGNPTGLWTARAVDGRSPKYLMPKGAAGSSWHRLPPDRGTVVVEDVLSAIAVSKAGLGSMAVLGTSPSATQVALLDGRPVYGWFDNDAGGRKGWVALRKVCAPFGIVPIRIQSDKDPKAYSRHEILKYIKVAT